MADIAMCQGEGCPKRDECYRHTAPKSLHRQSYFTEAPLKASEPFECDYYLPILQRKEQHHA